MRVIDSGLRFKDYCLAVLVGAAVFFFSIHWGSEVLHPSVYDDFAVAAGLRPPESPIPGLWRVLTHAIVSWLGVARAYQAMIWLGRAVGALLAVEATLVISLAVPLTIRERAERSGWAARLAALLSLVGSLFLLFSDPIWHVIQAFTPTTLLLLMLMLAIWACVRLKQTLHFPYAYIAIVIFGLMSAETIFAVAFAASLLAWAFFTTLRQEDQTVNPLANPVVRNMVLKNLLALYFAALVVAVSVNVWSFIDSGGMEANDWQGLDLLSGYVRRYGSMAIHAAAPLEWLTVLIFVGLPFYTIIRLQSRATDAEWFLTYKSGLVTAGVGILAFSQLSGFSSFCLWRWFERPVAENGGFLQCLVSMAAALTLLYALAIIMVEVYFRNTVRLYARKFPDDCDLDDANRQLAAYRSIVRMNRRVAWMGLALLPLAVVPFARRTTDRGMLGVIGAYLDEMALECRDIRFLLTDGAMDSGLEIARARVGGEVIPLPMMHVKGSYHSEYERSLRARGARDAEDEEMVRGGAANALRTWVREKPQRLDKVALQLGFELWKRNGAALPPCSGLVAYPSFAVTDVELERGAGVARGLAERILALYEDGHPETIADRDLYEAFLCVQFRVARLCEMRADIADLAGDRERTMEENRLMAALNAKNRSLQKIFKRMDWIGNQKGFRTTPREGLRMTLERADFELARPFAERILQADAGDPQANFAMGMYFFMQGQHVRAGEFLKRILERKPNDIAALNNLAVIATKLGRKKEALYYAEKAYHLAPQLPDVRRTHADALAMPDDEAH